jgi:hypothetical protein
MRNGHFFGVAVLLCASFSLAPPSRAQTDDRAAIQELLDSRAAAVADADRDAFLATVAGSDRFRAHQESLFEGLLSLPLASYELQANWWRAGDLVTPSVRRRYPEATDVAIPLTEERYALEGIDDEPALEDLVYTFVETSDGWRIAADDDLEDVGLFSARRLWDAGPVTLKSEDRFLLIEHPCSGSGSRPYGCADIPDDLLDTADASLRAAERTLPKGAVPRRVAIVAPGTQSELARMLQATYELDNFLAFATSSVDTSDGIEFTGHRIVLNWDQIRNSSTGLPTLLTHEFVHIGTRRFAGPFTPFFVEEGIAEHVSRRGDPESLAFLEEAIGGGTFDERLPEDHEFRTGGPGPIFLSYKESQSAITFFVERWGADAFLDFYRDLGGRKIDAGTSAYHVDRALRRTIGIGLQRFERAWADSIT